jgi:hypothetical protein
VRGSGTSDISGNVVVTLSGSAAFTSSGSYSCTATTDNNNFPSSVVQSSGSSFTINVFNLGHLVQYICVGN